MQEDADRLVVAAEAALKAYGMFYSKVGDGRALLRALRDKHPKAEIDLVVFTLTGGGFILGSNDLHRPEDTLKPDSP
jgi:hypothetical protein